jgi:hypothetical protein
LWKGLKKLEDKVKKLGGWADRWGEKGAELIEKYNAMVKQLLDTWSENKGKKYTPDEAKKFLEDELIPLLNDFIDRANRLE